mmetsp:Transcript_12941/g.19608  ORF Transcript_12941/g.19608 Transcript_12941/m.19608 type:complete len:88 (-) Transcript_12941:799-1062(-)
MIRNNVSFLPKGGKRVVIYGFPSFVVQHCKGSVSIVVDGALYKVDERAHVYSFNNMSFMVLYSLQSTNFFFLVEQQHKKVSVSILVL